MNENMCFFRCAAIICMMMLFGYQGNTQDVAFSQFIANPIYLNPALAGQYNGTYRLSGSYRDQWIGALDHPYKSFSIAGDLRFDMNKGLNAKSDIASFGFVFLSDNTNSFDLNTNQISAVGAYHKYLGGAYDSYLGLGVQFGILQKSINYENVVFQDQFNAINDYTLATGEDLPINNFAVLDFKVGLNYSLQANKNTSYMFGVSYGHFTQPNVSFYQTDESTNPEIVTKEALDSKITAYISGDYKVGFLTKVQPRAVIYMQGDHFQSMLGSNFRFTVSKPDRTYFHIGPWVRLNNGIDGFEASAAIVSVAYEIKDFVFGVSYDHGISDLLNERVGMNTLELSVQYFGESEDSEDTCPKF